MKKILQVKDLCFSYYKAPFCLKDVYFSLSQNEKIFLLGRKDVGKSTLLKVVSNFETSYFGAVLLNDKNVKEYENGSACVSLLLGKPVFFENKSIQENIDYLCDVQGIKRLEKDELEKMLVDWKIDRNVGEKVKKLTLLEKRKLSVLRSVVKNPAVMFVEDLFDGFENCDFEEMKNVYNKLLKLNISAIFEIESETYKKDKNFFNKLQNRTLFLSFTKIYEYDSIVCCVNDLKNIDYFEYDNMFAIFADLIKDGEDFYFEIKDKKFDLPTGFKNKLKDFDLCEIENVVLFFKSDVNIEKISTDVIDEMCKNNEFYVCSRVDGQRLI